MNEWMKKNWYIQLEIAVTLVEFSKLQIHEKEKIVQLFFCIYCKSNMQRFEHWQKMKKKIEKKVEM